MQFNEKIKLLRPRNLTQKQVADYVDVDEATVSNWERGKSKPQYKHLIKLSDLYECKINDFFDGVEV